MHIPYPRQVILVTSRDKGKDNVMTLSWHSPASFNPELYTIYVGKTRYSYEMIKNSKCFCVNFISKDDSELALTAGRKSGRDVDKFKEIEKEECKEIDCPRVKKALAYMECKLIDEFEAGDHAVFVGKVVKKEEVKRGGRLFQVEGDKFTTTL
ncbi:flavin reductase family protein [Candidatus Woesearchaeota archaeon]|nr:flavin reductase family protein [Candidatus Woesearchaeota archaeon]